MRSSFRCISANPESTGVYETLPIVSRVTAICIAKDWESEPAEEGTLRGFLLNGNLLIFALYDGGELSVSTWPPVDSEGALFDLGQAPLDFEELPRKKV